MRFRNIVVLSICDSLVRTRSTECQLCEDKIFVGCPPYDWETFYECNYRIYKVVCPVEVLYLLICLQENSFTQSTIKVLYVCCVGKVLDKLVFVPGE